ncbi:MAG: hypothetical protein JWN21_684 [Sphingomonas bacterium]|uniref:hypothetical protein n=1 Tax=Sphingomonas bacterium TaxID=1895847 RepID=UPI002629076A|nr:hypothetical protein [Sphingomonas bacterium]MDB5695141.1 hypothetical protein [Sphingomonas bacterium]
MILLAALLQLAPMPAEIVVVARKRRCDIAVANRILSSREFNARAAEWAAGVPVRVSAPDSASRKCLAKIVFKLADRGVAQVEFVEP